MLRPEIQVPKSASAAVGIQAVAMAVAAGLAPAMGRVDGGCREPARCKGLVGGTRALVVATTTAARKRRHVIAL